MGVCVGVCVGVCMYVCSSTITHNNLYPYQHTTTLNTSLTHTHINLPHTHHTHHLLIRTPLLLTQIRTYLDKIRPIDKRLSYQIQRLLQAAHAVRSANTTTTHGAPQPPTTPAKHTNNNTNTSMHDDPLSYAPNPDAMLTTHGGGGGTGRTGVDHSVDQYADAQTTTNTNTTNIYRPPKLNPTAMEDDPDHTPDARRTRHTKHMRQKALRSEMVRELLQEVEEAPEEVGVRGVGVMSSAAAIREAQQRSKITEVEEELMTRIVLSKVWRGVVFYGKKRKSRTRRMGVCGCVCASSCTCLSSIVVWRCFILPLPLHPSPLIPSPLISNTPNTGGTCTPQGTQTGPPSRSIRGPVGWL